VTWQYKREPVLTRARLVNSMLMGLVLGLVYFQQEATYKAVQNKLGVLFIITINQTISSMFGVVQVEKKRIYLHLSYEAFLHEWTNM
jgi:hypothetical protein